MQQQTTSRKIWIRHHPQMSAVLRNSTAITAHKCQHCWETRSYTYDLVIQLIEVINWHEILGIATELSFWATWIDFCNITSAT